MIDLLHHVGIVVRDADAALAFYRDVIGFPVVADSVLDDQGVRAILLAVGENELEILSPTDGDTGVARFLESRGETLHHLCFRTDDIVAELARLEAAGVELVDREPRSGLAGQVAFLHPRAMRGVLVELAQPPADAHRRDAKGFDRVAVRALDFDAAATLWHEVVGLSVARRFDVDVAGVVIGQMPIGRCLVELIAPSRADAPFAREIERSGEGAMPAIALEVADVDAEVARLRGLGVELDDAGPGMMPGTRSATISAEQAFGVAVQLATHERGDRGTGAR
jgi:methylmalonyl-CoA/ethylmalonyl-CoA epimerase